MTAENHKPTTKAYTPRVPRYVTMPSRLDGISRALKKSYSQDADMPSDLGALVERLKRIDS